MGYFLSPIFNLKLDQNIVYSNIFEYDYFKDLVLPYFQSKVGSIELNIIKLNNNFFVPVKINYENPSIQLHRLSALNNHFLSIGFWLQKDCSIHSPISFLFDNENNFVIKDTRNEFYSNSHGKYESTFFSENELNSTLKSYNKLLELISRDKVINLVETSGHIRSSMSTINYNDLNKIQRAIFFIQKARGTSLLPEKITNYIVSIETLFSFSENSDLTFKISYRVPHYLSNEIGEREIINEYIRKGYDVRSRYLHGDKLKSSKDKEILEIISNKLDEYLRNVFNIIITNEEYKNIILDEKLFKDFFHKKLIGQL